MKVIKEQYIAPQTEVIEIEVIEAIMTGSDRPGADDNGDPDVASSKKNSFWK